MSEDYQFEVNSPKFQYHFPTKDAFGDVIDGDLKHAFGYRMALDDFCLVIKERVESGLGFEELKAELLGLVKDRENFEQNVKNMHP